MLKLGSAYECDYFVHTWSVQEMRFATWRQPDDYAEGLDPSLLSRLGPRVVIIEDAEAPELLTRMADYLRPATPPWTGAHFMLYGMARVHSEFLSYCESLASKYDVVMRYRFDLMCDDMPQLAQDISRVGNDELLALMPFHHWATPLGARFDGVVIASPHVYARFIGAVPTALADGLASVRNGDPVVPELFVVDAVNLSGAELQSTRAKFQLVRSLGYVEQVFGAAPRMLQAQLATASIVLRGAHPRRQSYLYSRWEKHSTRLVRVLALCASPLYRALSWVLWRPRLSKRSQDTGSK